MSKYKLVPIEPTQEMIHAGQMAVSGFPRDVLERWQAMLAAAPTMEPVGFCEDTALTLSERTFSSEVDEQVTEVEAPSHSLPDWSECNLRVGNSEWLKDNDRKPEHDSLTANPLHEFIYEYDDSDAYKSAWFLHRLEKLIGFIKSEQQPSTCVSESKTPTRKESWWAGYRAGKGLPANTPRQVAINAPDVSAPEVAKLVESLEVAHRFIANGIELGYIQMPDSDTLDPAHETLPAIEAALAEYRAQGGDV